MQINLINSQNRLLWYLYNFQYKRRPEKYIKTNKLLFIRDFSIQNILNV